MFKQCLTLLATLATIAPLLAQKGSWGELPMIPPKSFAAKKAAEAKISGTPAHEKALRVYERLREARGDFRNPVPEFYLTSNETVAEILYEENAIYLGEKAFEVCESFSEQSESAIAFLLGHELSHYYEKHAWRKSFAYKNSDLGALTQLDTLYKSILGDVGDPSLRGKLLRFDTLIHLWDKAQLEAQADYLGGFLAYTAGYGAFFRGDELIAKLYRAFDMPDQLDGYLSRNERQAFSKKAAQQLSDLVDIFEMANLLTAVGEYEEAYRFYRKVLTEYQSREVYNNVGAAATLHALKYFTAQELPYRYPVQLDLKMANSRGGEEVAIRKKLLEQAVQHFDAAISLDPGYAPALLNKACALALLGDRDRAYFYADLEARRAATGKYASNLTKIEIVLAILDAQSPKPDGKEKAAKRLSDILPADQSGLAAYNLAIVSGKKPPAPPAAPSGFFDDETIDGQNVLLMAFPQEDKRMDIDEALTFHQNTQQGKQSRTGFSRKHNKNSVLFHLTNLDYSGQTGRGIKRMDKMSAVEAQYGAPKHSIQTPTGQIWVFDEILFVMKSDAVERWALFKKF